MVSDCEGIDMLTVRVAVSLGHPVEVLQVHDRMVKVVRIRSRKTDAAQPRAA